MNIYEIPKNNTSKIKKDREGEELKKKPIEEIMFQPERKEEKSYYDMLREELRSMKDGGVDIHFGEINVDDLSFDSLELYRKYKKNELTEDNIAEFREKFIDKKNEHNFAAMILNWKLDKIAKDKLRETEFLKKEALDKLDELKKKSPHIAAYAEGINWEQLKGSDYKVIINLNKENFEIYSDKLKQYFRNRDDTEENIAKDPRFRYYQMLRELMHEDPIDADKFMQGL